MTLDLSNDPAEVAEGRSIFRSDTFGDETPWTDALRLHEVIATAVGITCALCHSTVDDSFAPGIGKRLDGWAPTTTWTREPSSPRHRRWLRRRRPCTCRGATASTTRGTTGWPER